MKSFLILLFVVLIGPNALPCLEANGKNDVPSPKFKITTRRADDIVEVHEGAGRAVVEVQSPFGISQATFERLEGHWPKALVVRLHLKGLENFEVGNGRVVVRGTAGIRDGKVETRLWKDNQEDNVLDSSDPFWIDIRVQSSNDKPASAVPLKEGYFELTLPKAFFDTNPKTLTLKWIDFYRG